MPPSTLKRKSPPSPSKETSTSPASSQPTTPSLDPGEAAITILQDIDGSLEFHATYANEHGTGHTTIVSNPESGRVDIVLTQLVGYEIDGQVSLSLPPEAAAALVRALSAGLSVALQEKRRTKYN